MKRFARSLFANLLKSNKYLKKPKTYGWINVKIKDHGRIRGNFGFGV